MRRPTICLTIRWTIAFTFLLSGVMSRFALAQSDVRLEVITKAWKTRQTYVQSAKFHWTERRFEAKGWKKNPQMLKSFNPEGLTIPAEDLVYELESHLSFDGDKYRYTTKNTTPKGGSNRSGLPPEQIRVFDGKVAKIYSSPDSEREYPQGEVQASMKDRKKDNERIKNVSYIKPFLWAFRLPNESEFRMEAMRVSPRPGVVADRTCLILEEGDPTSTKTSIWLEPARQFLIARFTRQEQGKTTIQFDISYIHSTEHNLWVPSVWKYATLTPDGMARLSAASELIDYSINPKIESSEFELQFPPGTWVTVGGSNGGMYIQREGGKKRIITNNELGASYDQYVKSESGMAWSASSGFPRRWVFVVAIGSVLLVLCLLLLRRAMRGPARI